MPVYTPLLEEIGAGHAVRFLRAVVDFIILAIYSSYNDDTLRFMQLALFRINNHKEELRKYRPIAVSDRDADGAEGYFNFPKFHAIAHYPDMIRRLGNAPELETGHFEHKHVVFVKTLFRLTNKKAG